MEGGRGRAAPKPEAKAGRGKLDVIPTGIDCGAKNTKTIIMQDVSLVDVHYYII